MYHTTVGVMMERAVESKRMSRTSDWGDFLGAVESGIKDFFIGHVWMGREKFLDGRKRRIYRQDVELDRRSIGGE
jgi:hypothetical protein